MFSWTNRTLLAGTVALTVTVSPTLASEKASEANRIQESTQVLESLVSAPDDAIPEYVLERAQAIVVIPRLVKGGLVVGAEHGSGVMSVRDRTTGAWSLPSFVKMTGGSVGWQIGLQAVDLVLVVLNREGVDDLLKNEFTLGANASVAAGPVGRSGKASTDALMSAQILAYSRAKGLFAGATIEGSSLRDDVDANEDFYGKRLSARQLFDVSATTLSAHPVASSWRDTLTRVASRRASR